MSPYAVAVLCILALLIGVAIGVAWGTWDMRTEQPHSHEQHALERRVRFLAGSVPLGGTSYQDHPAVATKGLPYDRTREDQPI